MDDKILQEIEQAVAYIDKRPMRPEKMHVIVCLRDHILFDSDDDISGYATILRGREMDTILVFIDGAPTP